MNWYLDVFSDNDSTQALATIQRLEEGNRSGPCEDDVESCAPYVGLLPEETAHEDPSPLNFGRHGGDDMLAPPRRLISLGISFDEAT